MARRCLELVDEPMEQTVVEIVRGELGVVAAAARPLVVATRCDWTLKPIALLDHVVKVVTVLVGKGVLCKLSDRNGLGTSLIERFDSPRAAGQAVLNIHSKPAVRSPEVEDALVLVEKIIDLLDVLLTGSTKSDYVKLC